MNKVLATILAFALSGQAVAEECQAPVTVIQSGQASPCDGFIFSKQKEAEVRYKIIDYDLLTEQSKLYLQQKELYQKALEDSEQISDKETQKSELWRQNAEKATQKLTEQHDSSYTRDLVAFGLGLLTSIATVYALHNVSK